MSPLSFPEVTWGDNPYTPYFYVSDVYAADYNCAAADQLENGSINVLCSNYDTDGTPKLDNKLTCSGPTTVAPDATAGRTELNCEVKLCTDLQAKYCTNGDVTLFDMDDSTVIGICTLNGEDANCMDRPVNDIKRPGADDVPTEHMNKWYVGDATYDQTYNYQCTEDADSIDGYYNALCASSGAFDASVMVYCNYAATDGLSEAYMPFCGATKCEQLLDAAICDGGVDMYSIEDGAAKFAFTCIKDTSDGAKTPCSTDQGSGAKSFAIGITAFVMGAMLM